MRIFLIFALGIVLCGCKTTQDLALEQKIKLTTTYVGTPITSMVKDFGGPNEKTEIVDKISYMWKRTIPTETYGVGEEKGSVVWRTVYIDCALNAITDDNNIVESVKIVGSYLCPLYFVPEKY